VNATTNAPCEHGWPARECTRHDDGAAYVSPILLIVGISALGYVAIGATLIVLGGLAWDAIRAHLGG
jgi:hypothetical protein